MLGLVRLLLALALLAAAGLADTWVPYGERVAFSKQGKYYMVTRATRAPGDQMAYELYEALRPRKRQPGDKLLVRGTHSQLPVEVKLLDTEPSAVLFESYGNMGRADCVALIDGKGALLWRVNLMDLFTNAQIRKFTQTVGSVWWNRGWWITERRGKVVVVSVTGITREIDLETGAVVGAMDEVLLERVKQGTLAERMAAIETAGRRKPKGLVEVVREVAVDPKEPPALRLRAVVALRRAGARADASVFKEVMARGSYEDKRYAISNLGEALGPDAIPLAKKLARSEAPEGYFAPQGLEGLQDAAVPALLELLLDERVDITRRYQCAFTLEKIKTAKSSAALVRGVAEAPKGVAFYAQLALVRGQMPGLVEHLCALLRKGTTQDGNICFYFVQQPDERAIEPLVIALGRAKTEIDVVRARKALEETTGKRFGDRAEDWREGLGLK